MFLVHARDFGGWWSIGFDLHCGKPSVRPLGYDHAVCWPGFPGCVPASVSVSLFIRYEIAHPLTTKMDRCPILQIDILSSDRSRPQPPPSTTATIRPRRNSKNMNKDSNTNNTNTEMRKTIFSNKRHTTNIDIFFHISIFPAGFGAFQAKGDFLAPKCCKCCAK